VNLRAASALRVLALLAALASPAGAEPGGRAESELLRVYVGTYTDGDSRGIYRLELDLGTGALGAVGEPTPAADPSFLALHPGGRFLYAVNELGEGPEDQTGTVSAFSIDPETGALTFLNRQPSGGASPCHLAVDPTGRYVLVANYHSGSIAVLPIGEDGRLGPASARVQHEGHSVHQRQKAPHAHWIDLDPSGRFALVVDLGLDRILSYRLDDAGRLTRHEAGTALLRPGAGPRHLAFRPDGRRAYVIDEIDSTVAVFAYDADTGRFESRQSVSTLPEGYQGRNATAEIAVHPGGRFVYGSNRGHDSIAIFAIDEETGDLRPQGHVPSGGRTPRHFAIEPGGRFLLAADQGSDSVVVFRISERDGSLAPVGEPVHVPRPVCLVFAAPQDP